MDVLGTNILMSDEANNEIEEYLNSNLSMIDTEHNLTYGLGTCKIIKFTLSTNTFDPGLDDIIKKERSAHKSA